MVRAKMLKETASALTICAVAELFVGLVLGGFDEFLVLMPGLFVIIPPTIGMRGNVYGSFGAKLSTYLHTGEIEGKFRGNERLMRVTQTTFFEVLVLTYSIPLLAVVFAKVLGISSIDIIGLFFVMVFSSLTAGSIMTVATISLTLTGYRKNIDPDNITTPFITTIGDAITIPIMFIGVFVYGLISWEIGLIVTVVVLLAVPMMYLKKLGGVKTSLLQRLPVMVICIVISLIAGLFLESTLETIFYGSVFLLLIPLYNGEGGSIGSINASKLSTAYYLGENGKSWGGKKSIAASGALAASSLPVFLLSGILAFFIARNYGMSSPPLLEIIAFSLGVGIVVTVVAIVLSHLVTKASVKLGIDPDNVTIPIITSIMDLVGVASIIGFLYLF